VATTAFVEALPVAMGDNRIINGNFAVNPRGYASGTALPATPVTAAYGHDRWKAGAGGCTYTFTAAVPDTTITITANTLTQIIEAGVIEGGVYTLSWTGTAQARVYQGTPAGSYAASPVVTASLPGGTNTTVEFNTGTVGKVKFEIGAIATAFNRQSLAKNIVDCQRYFYQKSASIDGWLCVAQAFAAGQAGGYMPNPVAMRAAPTVTVTPASSIQCYNAGGSALGGFTGGSMTGAPLGVQFNISGSSGLVSGNATVLFLQSSNSSVLTVSAELLP
jgi:hypothetical protein